MSPVPSTLWSRIQEALGLRSAPDIARKLGLAKQSVYDWEKGKTPALDTLVVIAKSGNTSLHWLITGEGVKAVNGFKTLEQGEIPIYFGPKEHEIIQRLAGETKRTFEDQVRELIIEKLEEMGHLTTKTGESNLIFFGESVARWVELPLMGEIAAGEPLLVFENQGVASVPEFARKPNKQYMALRARGDSMIDDRIYDGSLLICEATNTAQTGDTIVAVIDGEAATVKKYFPERGRIRLQPANPAHLPQYVTDDRLRIQGIVVAVFHKPS